MFLFMLAPFFQNLFFIQRSIRLQERQIYLILCLQEIKIILLFLIFLIGKRIWRRESIMNLLKTILMDQGNILEIIFLVLFLICRIVSIQNIHYRCLFMLIWQKKLMV